VGKKAKKIGEYRLPDKERYDQEAVKEKPSTKDHEQAIVLTASCLILLAAPIMLPFIPIILITGRERSSSR
jgi:hypothetical protein